MNNPAPFSPTFGVVYAPPMQLPPTEPVPMPKPAITSWSFTRWDTWNKCPRKAYYRYVLKLPEPASEAAQRGRELHAQAEAVLQGITATPPDLSPEWAANLAEVRSKYDIDIETEVQLAFDKNWKQVEWFAKDTWLRVVFDALIVLPGEVIVLEHKSGKPRPTEHNLQTTLYLAAAQALVPDATRYTTRINYFDIDYRDTASRSMHSATAPAALAQRKYWNLNVAPMLADTLYPTKAGPLCRFCHLESRTMAPVPSAKSWAEQQQLRAERQRAQAEKDRKKRLEEARRWRAYKKRMSNPDRLERVSQAAFVRWCTENGHLVTKTDTRSRRGWPDLVVVTRRGRVVWVELKAPRGYVSKAQGFIHGKLIERKQWLCVAHSTKEAIAAIRLMESE